METSASVPRVQRASVSGWLLAAAILLFVLGGLGLLSSLVVAVVALVAEPALAAFGAPVVGEELGAFLAVTVGIGVAAGSVGVLHIVSGVGVLRRASWGRVTGAVGAVLGILLTVGSVVWGFLASSLVDPFMGQPLVPQSGVELALYLVVDVLTVAAYLFVLLVLVRRGDEFGH